MSAGAAAPERRPRLNPFAFPSDTAFRFGLLITAVIGANLYVWEWIATVFADKPRVLSDARGLPVVSDPGASGNRYRRIHRVPRAGLSLPGVVDARRNRRPAARGRRDHARAPALDHSPATLAATDARGRAGGARRGPRAGERAGDPRAATSLESARCIAGRARFRPPGPLLGRAHGRPPRQTGDRPPGLPRDPPARARPHSQPRCRHHVLHDRDLVRVPPRRGPAVCAHAVRRGRRLDLQRHVETARARSSRLPDPQRGAALTRGLRRRARVRFRRAGWGIAARAGGAAPAGRGVARKRAARAPRPESPACGSRRHPAALPARRRRRIRGRPLRDDRLRQRRHAPVLVHHRPRRHALRGRTGIRAARRGRRRRCRLARGVRCPRGRARARLAVGRRPSVVRRSPDRP